MAAITITGNLLHDLAIIASATGNTIADVNYQCADTRPYFRFGTGYYTTLHPDNVDEDTATPVYEPEQIVKDGITYDSMVMVGSGTQNGSTLTYGGSTHAYQNTHVNIREHRVRKWSKCKPILATGWETVDFSGSLPSRETSPYKLGLYIPTSLEDENLDKAFSYQGLPSVPCTGGTYARLRDFNGYDPRAVCTLSSSLFHRYANGKHTMNPSITHFTDTPTSIDFNSFVEGSGTPVEQRYLAITIEVEYLVVVTEGTYRRMKKWYTSKLYSDLNYATPATLGTGETRNVYLPMQSLVELVEAQTGAAFAAQYRAMVWLSKEPLVGSDWTDIISLPDGSLPIPPLETIRWRPLTYWMMFTDSYYVAQGAGALITLNFHVEGDTDATVSYYCKYKYTYSGTAYEGTKPLAIASGGTAQASFLDEHSPLQSTYAVEYEVYATSMGSTTVYTLLKGNTTVYRK